VRARSSLSLMQFCCTDPLRIMARTPLPGPAFP